MPITPPPLEKALQWAQNRVIAFAQGESNDRDSLYLLMLLHYITRLEQATDKELIKQQLKDHIKDCGCSKSKPL